MQIGKYRLEGGGSCPEQYDVFDGEQAVGYLRLRHGHFTADLTVDGQTEREVYESGEMRGDGCFFDDEREQYLTAAVQAIDAARCPNAPDERSGGQQALEFARVVARHFRSIWWLADESTI